ncbi:Zn-dependent alcohol dehydrogenase [Aquihabitans sp. G128]|uniref:Zn-dependent alcohol dehydrogenase n=1 Tax=Aquihabitans sp. G128 TaxID=2849779 RepID=UPI001C21817D|nr:Zn-dependent alcohol dehydrogenase [Aquihabitans sp. G128]QXC60928.1 Zn-dependent alcohol dehydrogenase [Aquihabitans sp. G128]
MKAAVLPAVDTPIEVRDDIEVAAPGPGEVRVRVAASGVCHSDLSVQNGTIRLPTPIVLGHEGAGVVEEVGEGVSTVAVGDHVVLTFVPACGECHMCLHHQSYLCERASLQVSGGLADGTTRLTSGGAALHQMAYLGTFGEQAIVPAISLVKIPESVPLEVAALLGCGVLTGVGAALNTATIAPGDTVVVFGCGGVGLNVIQGARIAGATTIIAVDQFASKLDLARSFGATHTIDSTEEDPVSAVAVHNEGRGADVAFEVVGLGPVIEQAIKAVRSGGEVVLVGVPRMDVVINLNVAFTWLYQAKKISGCWYGSSNVHEDVPKLLDLWERGELQLEDLISKEITVDQVNEAFADMQAGTVARSVIRHG